MSGKFLENPFSCEEVACECTCNRHVLSFIIRDIFLLLYSSKLFLKDILIIQSKVTLIMIEKKIPPKINCFVNKVQINFSLNLQNMLIFFFRFSAISKKIVHFIRYIFS